MQLQIHEIDPKMKAFEIEQFLVIGPLRINGSELGWEKKHPSSSGHYFNHFTTKIPATS